MALFKNKSNFASKHIVMRSSETIADNVLIQYKKYKNLSKKEIQDKTKEFMSMLNKGKTLESIMVDAFSLVTEVIRRITTFEMHKVQIMASVIINNGDIAELRTGEGKTLSATLPAYLNSLKKEGVIIVTVNEYLAKRDAEDMGKIYDYLGITCGVVLKDQSPTEKRSNYSMDITYVTNSELGFDYLRDNMVKKYTDKSQRKLNYAIIDEADSVVIDEARTPLIISGRNNENDSLFERADMLVKRLKDDDYEIDKESKSIFLTGNGIKSAEKFFDLENLYNVDNAIVVHRIQNSLYANKILVKDVDYSISSKEKKIEIIDIFTGRILTGRSYSNGLHQAVEAKEKVEITPETVIHSTITYQNLFRLFKKLSGMTGTAVTEEEEFLKVFNMRVFAIPTNLPIIRSDLPDSYFATKRDKWKNVISEIKKIHGTGQPILVGTRSVEDSEYVYSKLKRDGLTPNILNAKNNEREAEIISEAGKKNSITISTNMAGRGTDIKLGKGVIDLGGLYVIGTERHESRRIDNQLRGRSGRQGDPGISKFFVSLQDEIMIRTGLGGKEKMFKKLGIDGVSSKTLTKAITSAQKRIEGMNFDSRKNLIEYDDVINQQREIIYKQRDLFMLSESTDKIVEKIIVRVSHDIISMSIFRDAKGDFQYDKFYNSIKRNFFGNEDWHSIENLKNLDTGELDQELVDKLIERYYVKFGSLDLDSLNVYQKKIFVDIMDANWQKHIDQIEKLKSGIQFRQYAQQNPLQLFISEANFLFDSFKERINHNIMRIILNTNISKTPTKDIRNIKK